LSEDEKCDRVNIDSEATFPGMIYSADPIYGQVSELHQLSTYGWSFHDQNVWISYNDFLL